MKDVIAALLLLAALSPNVGAQEIPLSSTCTVLFTDVETGRKVLGARDEFIAALSPYDRSSRLKTSRDVSENEFLQFASTNVLAWLPAETNRISGMLSDLAGKLARWKLPLPSTVLLIKTSGNEEGHASYTRQNAIILPQNEIRSHDLEGTIAHELFHILSRTNPVLRANAYKIIHFFPAQPFSFPAELQSRKITNPDGVELGWAIQVTNQRQALKVSPILFASTPRYDESRGGEFFNSMTFRFVVLTNEAGHWAAESNPEGLRFLEPNELEGFYAQVGRNTSYILHPDEILAVNFSDLCLDRTNVPSPEILAGLDRVLHQSSVTTK